MKTIRITRKQNINFNDFYECLRTDITGLILNINNTKSITEQFESKEQNKVFVVSFNDSQVYSLVFAESKKSDIYELQDISSKENEVNCFDKRELIDKVFIHLRACSRHSSVWSVKLINDYKNLKSIISSPIARDQLIYALKEYPSIHTPSENQKFDQFICLLYRYSRKKVEVDRFYEHLLKEMKIDKQEALSLSTKIENGFNLLDVYNHKYKSV